MTSTTIAQLADELNRSVSALLEQLRTAGMQKATPGDVITGSDKTRLLNYLKRAHGSAENDARKKITITRRGTSGIRRVGATGKTRTVQVEVKEKHVLVKRGESNTAQAEPEAAEATPVVDTEKVARREEEHHRQAELLARQEAKLRAHQEMMEREEAERRARQKAAEAEQKHQAELAAKKAEEEAVAAHAAAEASDEAPRRKAEEDTVHPVTEHEAAQKAADEARVAVDKIKAEKGAARKRCEAAEAEARVIHEMMSAPARVLKTPAERGTEEVKKTEQSGVLHKLVKPAGGARPTMATKKPAALALAAATPSSPSGDKKGGRGKSGWRDNNRTGKHGGLKTRGDMGGGTDDWRSGSEGGRSRHGDDNHNAFQAPTEPVVREVHVSETISVADLAHKTSARTAEIVRQMMELGQMVTTSQILGQETAIIMIEEMGHQAVAVKLDDPEAILAGDVQEQTNAEAETRPSVVTVMGHVDHGKTSLLDYIRRAKVATDEAGGITRRIGAYHIETDHGVTTFLDTPGHETFTTMRVRGTRATGIVVLVAAAGDGVMPQTKETIAHAKAAGMPIVVATIKVDKPGANPNHVRQKLVAGNVIPEKYGGDVPFVPVSTKTGEGIDSLLKDALLQAKVLELEAPINAPAKGLVAEVQLDKGKGPIATVLVQSGTFRHDDVVLTDTAYGRVHAILDESGKPAREAGPSVPVEIQGPSGVPGTGEEVLVLPDERKVHGVALFRQGKFRDVKLVRQQAAKLEDVLEQIGRGDVKSLPLIIKADVQGSQEALVHSLKRLSADEVHVQIVHATVGGITESDVNLATASKTVTIGFGTRVSAGACKLARNHGIGIRYYNVIYDAVDEVRAAMSGMLSPEKRKEMTSLVEVRQVLRVPRVGAVAGCMVLNGFIKRNSLMRVLRANVVIFSGELDSLERFKDDVKEVRQGFECGLSVKNFSDVQEDDQLEVYEITEMARTL